ncbi:uncharacterized protein TNCV_2089731 [Trichonephila clavipes]|nr:uncharacterized protein TNCV_2089731 [Trichonephila clavipes]
MNTVSEHRNQKRPIPEPKQGIKRAIPSSVSSRNYKYRRPNNPSQESQSIAGPSHQQDSRQDKSPTVASRHEGSGQYNKARETKTSKNGINRAAERRTVRAKQTTAVRPCPYYLRSRVRQPEGFPEEQRNIGIESIPQNNIRRKSLSMEALNGDPVDRSEQRTKKIIRLYRFFLFSFRTSGRKNYCNEASHGRIFNLRSQAKVDTTMSVFFLDEKNQLLY